MIRVLFVDDEAQARQGLRAGLYGRRKDWDMEFAEGGAQAIERMKHVHFDVLVTDLRMPVVNGAELIAHARLESPDTIRIVFSGYRDDSQSQRLVSLAHIYLSKPCETRHVERCIDRCLATRDLIQSPELRARLGAMKEMPPIPGTFAALQQALLDPLVELSTVASIIERDPAVAAKVLQACNSAFFRLPRRISRIKEAVNYLGFSTVRSMTLCAELFRPGAPLSPALDLDLLQRHSMNVAALARSLAADTEWADDAFMAGLLHDVGFLLLGRLYRDELQTALQMVASGAALADAEQRHVGVCHGRAGAYLLGLWGLPYEVVDAVADHQEAAASPGLDISSAVTIAQALMAEVRPQDVPEYDRPSVVGDDYLETVGLSCSWASLVTRAHELFNTGVD